MVDLKTTVIKNLNEKETAEKKEKKTNRHYELEINALLNEMKSADQKYYSLVIGKLEGALLRLEQLG